MDSNQDYCSYELSKALKAAGFDEPCAKGVKIIPGTEREEWDEEECQWCTVQDIEYYPKITLWQAQKWLRERKGIAINVDAHDGDFYTWEAVFLSNASPDVVIEASLSAKFSPYVEKHGSYERALSVGISAVLELIKKGSEI